MRKGRCLCLGSGANRNRLPSSSYWANVGKAFVRELTASAFGDVLSTRTSTAPSGIRTAAAELEVPKSMARTGSMRAPFGGDAEASLRAESPAAVPKLRKRQVIVSGTATGDSDKRARRGADAKETGPLDGDRSHVNELRARRGRNTAAPTPAIFALTSNASACSVATQRRTAACSALPTEGSSCLGRVE
jgi:hypothetical protein